MPIRVRRMGRRWKVCDDDGKTYGVHSTKGSASKQRRAIYANKGKK